MAESILKLLSFIAEMISRFLGRKDTLNKNFAQWVDWSQGEGGKSTRMKKADKEIRDKLEKEWREFLNPKKEKKDD